MSYKGTTSDFILLAVWFFSSLIQILEQNQLCASSATEALIRIFSVFLTTLEVSFFLFYRGGHGGEMTLPVVF